MGKDKKIVYIDMDGVACDYVAGKEKALELNPKIPFPQSQYGFFTNLEPMKNFKGAWNWLLTSKKFDPYLLTAPSVKNPLCYTEKAVWVQNLLGEDAVERLIISNRKDLNMGDFLIDDNTSGRGQENFKGELIHFGSERYPDWVEVLEYLVKI